MTEATPQRHNEAMALADAGDYAGALTIEALVLADLSPEKYRTRLIIADSCAALALKAWRVANGYPAEEREP